MKLFLFLILSVLNDNFITHIISNSFPAPRSIQPFDLDNDFDIDIIAVSQDLDMVVWFENDGNQNFNLNIIDSLSDGAHSAQASDLDNMVDFNFD